MKRIITIFVAVGFAFVLSSLAYFKGYYDGGRRDSEQSLEFDTDVFNHLEKSEANRAQSNLAMFIIGRYDWLKSANFNFSTLKRMLYGRSDNARYERAHNRAEKIADKYRGTLPTLEGTKAALEKDFPGLKINFEIE